MADSAVQPEDSSNKNYKGTEVVGDDPQLQGGRKSSREQFDHHSQLQLSDLTGNPGTNGPNFILQRLETSSHPTSTQQLHPSINDPGDARDLNYYLPLYKAALKGDWESAEKFSLHDPDAAKVTITSNHRTALHVAAYAGHSEFVKKLVEHMPSETLALRDSYDGSTALHYASVAGMTEAAKAMVTKNNNLTQIPNNLGRIPLLCAIHGAEGKKDIIQYLCTVTRNEEPCMPFSSFYGVVIVCNMIASNLLDVALYLVQQYPNLVSAPFGYKMLDTLSRKPSAFPSGSHLGFWQRLIYSSWCLNPLFAFLIIPVQLDDEQVGGIIRSNTQQNNQLRYGNFSIRGAFNNFIKWTNFTQAPGIKKVYLTKLAHIHAMELLKFICTKISLMGDENEILMFFLITDMLVNATEFGIAEVLVESSKIFPDQFWVGRNGRTILHMAVEHRQETIFNLMPAMSAQKKLIASLLCESNNNILHLVAKLAPYPQLNRTCGAALQMQRELQWYKEVEKLVNPTYKEMKNKDGDTPRVIFTREHKDLLEEGEQWMKDTAQSCTVIAALIVTVVFVAAFTAPGGNISDNASKDNGFPIFLHRNSFMVFIISDALALFTSTTSVLMFLSILTSRYAEEDFLYSLPNRMIIGLATLFFSIATMMISFSATLSIVLSDKLKWASFPIAAITCFPVTLFVLLQFPLLVEIVLSTYGSGIFHAKSKYKLY